MTGVVLVFEVGGVLFKSGVPFKQIRFLGLTISWAMFAYIRGRKDTPALKDVLLKTGYFEQAKPILKFLPVSCSIYSNVFRAIYLDLDRGTIST